jgi:hypothetical protein
LCLADAFWVAPHHPLAAAWFFGHQARLLQRCDVFLHSGERHRVGVGELGDRHLGHESSANDVAARCIGECPKDAVHLVVAEFHLYNHLVVR